MASVAGLVVLTISGDESIHIKGCTCEEISVDGFDSTWLMSPCLDGSLPHSHIEGITHESAAVRSTVCIDPTGRERRIPMRLSSTDNPPAAFDVMHISIFQSVTYQPGPICYPSTRLLHSSPHSVGQLTGATVVRPNGTSKLRLDSIVFLCQKLPTHCGYNCVE